ncbi:hypothetical protein DFAR_1540005 [Desulfarculales bacterium]
MDEVPKAEAKEHKLPKATRWAVLKAADGSRLTEKQQQALTELETGGFDSATTWRLKEMLRWIRKATSVRAAQWRITHFIRHALKCIAPDIKTLAPDPKALMTLEEHAHLILSLWTSNHVNTRLEELNGTSRPPGQEPEATVMFFIFMTMIYFIAAPQGKLIKFYS